MCERIHPRLGPAKLPSREEYEAEFQRIADYAAKRKEERAMADKIEGYLEVGVNDKDEVVINYPAGPLDVNGVGHIVFSSRQAYALADLLVKHARQASASAYEKEERRKQEAAAIPVDRTARVLSNGLPVTEDHREIDPATGQQKGYVVLTAAERAKGFVRPVRRSYRHVGKRPKYELRDLTPAESERYKECGYVKYEAYPELREDHSSVVGRFWTQAQLNSGCGTVTTMGLAIAETYARDPKFYSGTFCCGCQKHLPLEEFVWEGTTEQVGS